MQKAIIIVVSGLFFYACVKDKPNDPAPKTVELSASRKVYVINEGNFNTGNSSVSLYDPGNDEVIADLYETQNHSALGDVAQSMSFINGSYYIVVNNSGKIVVCDREFKKTGQISGLTSPRYILPITNQKAYVSDLYANAVNIVNLNTNTKTAAIPCFGKTERMVLIYNKVFVTNYDKDYVYIINAVKDMVEDSVFVGKNASSIVTDKNDKVWILSTSKLSRIDPLTHQSELVLDFAPADQPYGLCINKTKDTLYYINASIFRFAVSESSLPSVAFIAAAGKNFYGLSVNPSDFNIYAADALDYVQKSNIYVYGPDGVRKKEFKAGINSNGFYFE